MHGRMMHSVEGDLTFQAYGKEGEAIYSISRAQLNKILLDTAEENAQVNIHFNRKCVDVDLENATAHFIDENNKAICTLP